MCMLLSGSYAFYAHELVRRATRAGGRNLLPDEVPGSGRGQPGTPVADSHSPAGEQEIQKFRARRKDMEKTYDQYLEALHVYSPKMSEQQRLVLRVARIFGECELDMPRGFPDEVNKYIERWQASTRLAKAIETAKAKGLRARRFRKRCWRRACHRNSSIWRCRRATSTRTAAAPRHGREWPKACGSSCRKPR